MSANLRHFVNAVYSFDHVLKSANDKAFARPSPCKGWTGKDVAEHIFGSVKLIHSYAATGKGPTSAPKLGADPLPQWLKLRDQTLEALDHPGVLHAVAHEPFGPDFGSMEMDQLVGFMAAELAVHVWDMARAAKVDDRIDPALAKFSLAMWKGLPEPVLRMQGMMANAVKPAKGADAQTRLLNFLGRAG